MRGRIISTFLLWCSVGIILGVFGANGAIVFTAIAAALTQYELYHMMGRTGHRPMTYTGIAAGLLITLSPFYFPSGALKGAALFAPFVIFFSILSLLRKPRGNSINALAATLLGLLLVPYMLQFVGQIVVRFGGGATGLAMALWLVAATKFTDVGALLSGMAFGKHKMAPVLSPKKTWEGAVGGVLFSAGMSAAIVAGFHQYFPEGFIYWKAALIAIPVAIATIYADLLESAFKRESGVKDSGKLIPGIGGIFDLTDSFMLSAPTAYYLAVWIAG